MGVHNGGQEAGFGELAVSERASALCGAGECYAGWLREVEHEVRRACVTMARGQGTIPVVDILIHPDPRDHTPSPAMWSGVRHLADSLSARYGLQVVPIRLAEAILFRVATPPAAASLVASGRQEGRFRAWVQRHWLPASRGPDTVRAINLAAVENKESAR